MNFAKFLRASFTELLWTTASGFFIHFTVLPPGELIETRLFLFLHMFYAVFKRHECHEFKRSSSCCMEAHISR